MANKTSKSNEGYFAKYKATNRQASNRKLKLERQLKLQPNNAAQIELAIKNIHYRRKTPNTPTWSHQMIAAAKLMKEFTGKFDKLAFSADEKISSAALKARNPNIFEQLKPFPTTKDSMFSFKTRLAGWV